MYDFDEFDDEYDLDEEDDLLEAEDRLIEEEDDLLEKEDELMEREDDLRDAADDLEDDIRDHIGDQIDDLHDEHEDFEEMRRELAEIRRMKEQLRREIESVRDEKETRRRSRRVPTPPRAPRAPRAIRPPKPPRRAAIVDFDALTDSLEDMMDGLGDQIRLSVSGLKDVGKEFAEPFKDLKFASKRAKRRTKSSRSNTENIPPERVASVITPLASEERLKILDFLKGGGRTFKELEEHTGKAGSSLTHHLNPLLEAGYVIKGEVRGTYYLAVEGRLAYRLAQWLTDRLEREIRLKDIKEEKLEKFRKEQDGDVEVIIEDDEEDEQ
jgi:DNA-binding transcriptional ArsR family regulator